MALGTLKTGIGITIPALEAWSMSLSDADIAAIGQTITDDARFASRLGGGPQGAGGILTTGTSHSNTTVDTLVSTGGGPLSSIQPGMLVLASNVPPGTFVAAILSSTSVQLSQAATTSASGRVAFVPAKSPNLLRSGQLLIPGRGTLSVQPGDIVAVDNTGWPILVSGASIAYAGSRWTLT